MLVRVSNIFRFTLLIVILSSGLGLIQAYAQDLQKEQIKVLQANLNKLDLDVGRPDGVAGKKTRAAIAQLNMDYAGIVSQEPTSAALELSNSIVANRFNPIQEYLQVGLFRDERDDVQIDLSTHRNPCRPEDKCEPMDLFVASLDLDIDGDKDLVFATYYMFNGKNVESGKPVIFLMNDGAGRFTQQSFDVELDLAHVREAIVADFDGDGHDDLFLLDHGMDANPFPGGQNALVLSTAQGPKNVTTSNVPKRLDFSHGGAAGDLDGDGDMDILIITNESRVLKHNSYVLENDGKGVFSINDNPDYIEADLLDIRSRGHDFGLNNTAKIADYDNDGHLDIAWLASGDQAQMAKQKKGAQYTHITFSDGKNQYLSENTMDLPLKRWGHATFVTDLQRTDFDNDGDLDLIATSNTREKNQSWRGAYIDLLEYRGERKYVNVTHKKMFAQGYDRPDEMMWNHWVFPQDFNLDGKVDLAVMSLDPVLKEYDDWSDTTVKFALQNDAGQFLPLDPTWVVRNEYTMRRMRPVDVDNDGDMDLVGTRLLRSSQHGDDLAFIGFVVQVVENRTR